MCWCVRTRRFPSSCSTDRLCQQPTAAMIWSCLWTCFTTPSIHCGYCGKPVAWRENPFCSFFRHPSAPRAKIRSHCNKKHSKVFYYEFYHSLPSFVRRGSEFVEPECAASTGELIQNHNLTDHFSQPPSEQLALKQAFRGLNTRHFAPSLALHRPRVVEIRC